MGAPREIIEAARVPDEFDVWDENWDVVQLFLRMASQWFISTGVRTGLNYQSLDFLFKLFNIEKKLETFDDIQLMEYAALDAMKKKADS